MRRLLLLAAFCLTLTALGLSATLQYLSLDDMTQQSTDIVRGAFHPTYSEMRGSVVYTHYQVQVVERWKGEGNVQMDVAVPGGVSHGVQQTYAGAPTPQPGVEYVIFLWTSRSGLTQVIGLSQGLFMVSQDATGATTAQRAASTERMLNSDGSARSDVPVRFTLAQLRAMVLARMQASGRK